MIKSPPPPHSCETGREREAMAASTATPAGSDAMDAEAPLLDDVRGCVDFKDRRVLRSKTGCWKSASFIIGVEMAERFAYYGISSNLVSYLTGPLGQSTATAAANVNAWSGTASLSPLLGAFVADSFLGRFRTIIVASLLYILGLGSLSISAALNPSDSSPPLIDVIFFFFALYLVAFAVGGHKPCLQAFGADQFDDENGKELQSKSSFFNWWNFCLCVSTVVGLLVLTYIQENLSWGLGFGIPCIVMCFALLVFLFGMVTYRFRVKSDDRNPFVRIIRVFVRAAQNRHATPAGVAIEEEAQSIPPSERTHFRFLDRALLEPNGEEACSINDVEDAKAIMKLLPICLACLPFAIVYSQSTTLFTKQGTTMDRRISSNFQIPAAALQSFTPGSIILFVPFYEHVLIPISRAISHKPSGISLLQRIGTGLFLGIVCMVIAGFTERKRLETALEHGLVDLPKETVPMSVWWLIPQYLVIGIADVLTFVGLQEFFYDQVPGELKSMGLALSFCVAGVGGFMSSFVVSVVDKATSGHGQGSWLSDNLNRAHLDYFYWLLAGLNALSLILYIYFAKSYVYRKRITV